MPAFDLGLIDGNTWGAVSVDAIEAIINSIKDLTNADHLAALAALLVSRPLGKVAPTGTVVAALGPFTVQADIVGMSVAWAGIAGRLYRISGKIEITATNADGAYVLSLADANNVQYDRFTGPIVSTGGFTVPFIHVTTGAGAQFRKLRLSKAGGNGSLTMGGANNVPAYITVEDIGPA